MYFASEKFLGARVKLEDVSEIYLLISEGMDSLYAHKESISLRRKAFSQLFQPLVKQAFDTRRIDQETQYIARRGLKHYNRSDEFITESQQGKIADFKKIKNTVQEIKSVYGKDPNWQDSYCRILLSTLDTALRVNVNDGDFADTQTSVGSFDYVDELLFARYRLDVNNISKYGNEELKSIILNKDKSLFRDAAVTITNKDIVTKSYDGLMDKLFNVFATTENPEVERTVTITIKDKLIK